MLTRRRAKDRDRIAARDKEYYQKNKEKIAEERRRKFAADPDSIRAQKRFYRERSREHLKEYFANYYKNLSPEKKAQYRNSSRGWEHKNPVKALAKRQRRRIWEINNGGSFTSEEWSDLCNKYGNICLRCKQAKKLSPDHVVPVSKGGRGTIDNIQPLCRSCNSWKRAQTIDYRGMFAQTGA